MTGGVLSLRDIQLHYPSPMPPKRNFDAELKTLEVLRQATSEEALPAIIKALTHRNNFIVSKAAALAQHHNLSSLTPNLAEAFPRFLEDAAKSDPQCWAKNAIAKALAHFEYQDPDLYLRGMQHHQPEPVWGGTEDTAGTLRGVCALALVQCRIVNSHKLLQHLVPLLADKELSVRVNAARAIEQTGTDSSALLLRLRAELASDSPELLGACYSGVLALEGPSAIPWTTRFLPPGDDAAAEAAMAIAQTRVPDSVPPLKAAFERARDPWFRKAVLAALALTRQQTATDYLLDLIAKETRHATDAHEALCLSNPPEEIRTRLQQLGRPCP
jgi:HEAT repeat protein